MPTVVETRFYTTELMATPALAITVTDEATGYPKAYMNNGDLDRFFKFNTFSADRIITFDLGAAYTVDNVFVHVRNFATCFNGSSTIIVQESTNGSTWTSNGGMTAPFTAPGIMSSSLGNSKRYWRIVFGSLLAAPEVAMAALCSQHLIGNAAMMPNNTGKLYRNRRVPTESGRELVTAINSRPQRTLVRRFTSFDTTVHNLVVAAHDGSAGTLRPVIFQENSVSSAGSAGDGELIVCRFMDDELTPQQSAFEYYDLEVAMMELPSIPAGSVL